MLATYFYPVIPDKAAELFNMLGFEEDVKEKGWIGCSECDVAGNKLKDIKRLFDKIDDKVIEKDIKEFEERILKMSDNKPEEKALENVITIDDFFKAKLKTAKVLEAEKIEKSDKLLKLQIEVGDEKRQLVAGIAKHFAPEELIGKTIIIVANLKPAKLMGVESQGMLLAAKNDEEGLTLLTTEKPIKSGSSVG
jgi:methionyl-tRNA synthetase